MEEFHRLQDTDDLNHVEYSYSPPCSTDQLYCVKVCLQSQSLLLLLFFFMMERGLLLSF